MSKDIKKLIEYLDKTRKHLGTYHNQENCDLFMEEVLEYAIENWVDTSHGKPNLSENQWNEVRNNFIDKKYRTKEGD